MRVARWLLLPMNSGKSTLRSALFSFPWVSPLTALQAHPAAAVWRTKPFPLYDEILELVEGRYATGDHALHIPELQDGSSVAGDVDDAGTERTSLDNSTVCTVAVGQCSFIADMT
jgi:hypothetical protein